MVEMCETITLKVEVPPPIILTVDFQGEFLSSSDGEDYKRGYEEGHAQGLADGQADGYDKGYKEGKTVGLESGYTQGRHEGLTEGYNNGYAQGKDDGHKDGYDEGYQKGYTEGYEKGKAETVDYLPYLKTLAFSTDISEVTEDMNLNLENATTIASLFDGCTLNCNKVTVRISNICTNIRSSFRGNQNVGLVKEIEIVGDTSKVERFDYMFSGKNLVERIIGEFDFSSATHTTAMFAGCKSLIRFTPKSSTLKISISFYECPDLSDESIDAIVNAYADMTGQTAPVLTVHPTVKAKIVADDAKEDIDPAKRFWLRTLTSKNVTLA